MKLLSYQKVTLYETPSRFFLVGSDNASKLFTVLKIDRTDTRELSLSEDSHQYCKAELDDLLHMINNTVTKKPNAKSEKYTLRSTSCRGLIGFVRFLEGYYMILATKASRICRLGYHWFYKIEETAMLYVPNEQPKSSTSNDEQRYLRMFQAVDLSTNFYFSYTYDLSRTLSSNIVGPEKGFEEKYLWNNYLSESLFAADVSRLWILPIIHGYLGSCSLNVKNTSVNIILIARRSCKFAGTRFLKRGANFRGQVANEVETEQIVYDPTTSSLDVGRFTSFVQLRGSVPLFWSQDLTKVVGKPPIQMDLVDPFAVVPALHFRELRSTYGSPIVAISLVKRREKRMHESVLHDQFRASISYLNQFLDPQEAILYLSFDMARCHKAENVLPKLEEIGYNVVKLTGWFQTFQPLYCHEIRSSPYLDGLKLKLDGNRVLQSGVPRTNCVDCLDRTNVAMFVIGKVALAYQLHSLAAFDEPVLNWDTDVCRSFEDLYEEQGDTLALQYAGSQLVHSIRTYKKTALFQERSRDVIQTLSRYYSNTFADYDKQNALNIFLGVYRPSTNLGRVNLWDLPTDYWLHNSVAHPFLEDYCAWFDLTDDFLAQKFVPYRSLTSNITLPTNEMSDYDLYYRTYEISSFDVLLNSTSRIANVESLTPNTNNAPVQQTKPFWKRSQVSTGNRTVKEEDESDSSEEEGVHSDVEVVYSISWNDQSYSETNQQQQSKKSSMKKTNVTPSPPASQRWRGVVPCTKQVYGFELKSPNKRDIAKYEQFAKFDNHPSSASTFTNEERDIKSTSSSSSSSSSDRFARSMEITGGITLKPMSLFTNDSSFGVDLPEVSDQAVQKYCLSIACSTTGPRSPNAVDAKIYFDYVQSLRVS